MLTAGQTFARYVIEAQIGAGGMGEVYRAFDEKLRRKVALKVIHPDLEMPDAAARLVREARAAAALSHPNTVAIYDLGEIDGTVFLVMELVSGAPLRAYIGDGKVPLARKLRWVVDIARGLAAAHAAGLIHRDVKPANVMVSDEGAVKVLDFGLAKTVEAASFRSEAGLVAGTPRYMAAELFAGVAADGRSDQYAFGVTAYELLSGEYPGSAMGPAAKALDALVPEVGARVARVIARTLARAREDRFASMNDVVAALEDALAAPLAVIEPPATRREGPLALAATELERSALPKRSAATRGAIVLVAVACAAGYAALRFMGDDAKPVASDAATTDAADDAPAEAATDAGSDADAATTAPAPDDAASDADADAEADATSEPQRAPLPLDDFPDPWLKRDAR